MLDSAARRIIDPPLNRLGGLLAARGVTANTVTMTALGLGLLAALLVALGWTMIALFPLLLSRLCDGLDGAVARATQKTDFGGYLDIAADFFFYGMIPMAFVFNDPAINGAAGAFLLTSFFVNGTSFLGFAILAEKKDMETDAQGVKSLYYSAGLLEGTETILFLVAICIWPAFFPIMAWIFGTLCFFTALMRVLHARKVFPD